MSNIKYAGECDCEAEGLIEVGEECECDVTLPTRPLKTKRQLIDNFIQRLIMMKVEAGKLGLFETMHAIDTATTKVGYELAGQIKKKKAGGR